MSPLSDLLAAAFLIAILAARLYAGRLARMGVGDSDELFHLVYTRVIKANGHRLPDRFPQFVGPGRNTYPAAFHWALSYLPERAVDTIARHGALVGDLLLGAAISLLLATQGSLPTSAVLAVLGLYLVAPALIMVNLGPRSFHLSPRAASQVLYGAIIVAVMATSGDVSWLLGLAIALVLGLLLLSAKFALQVVLFAVPVLAVAGQPLTVLACFGGGCLFAMLISRGFFLRQVVAQFEHLRWYARRHLDMARSTSVSEIVGALRTGDIRTAARIVTLLNPLTSGVVRHLHLVAAGIWLLITMPTLDGTATVAAVFALAGVVGWVATSVGTMRVLGEPERYLEFAFPASWFLFWSLPHGSALVAVLILAMAYELALYLLNVNLMSRWGRRRGFQRPARGEALATLAGRGEVTALFLDFKEAYAVHGISGARAVMWSGQRSLRGEVADFQQLFLSHYTFVDPRRLHEIIARYEVDVIVARRQAVEIVRKQEEHEYPLGQFSILYENSAYTLFSTRSLTNLGTRDRPVGTVGLTGGEC